MHLLASAAFSSREPVPTSLENAFRSEWRLIFAGFFLCVIISFVRGVLRKRGAILFDVALVLLTIGLFVHVLR